MEASRPQERGRDSLEAVLGSAPYLEGEGPCHRASPEAAFTGAEEWSGRVGVAVGGGIKQDVGLGIR